MASNTTAFLRVSLALTSWLCADTITVMATLFAGPNFVLFMTAMGIALVTNLAPQQKSPSLLLRLA